MSSLSGLQVRVLDGPDEGSVTHLNFPKMTIGRARAAGSRVDGWVLLFDKSISRRHAELRWDHQKQHYVLKHLSETNFTWVNDNPLETEIVLELGFVVQMGGSRMIVEEFVEVESESQTIELMDEPCDDAVTETLNAPVQPLSLRGGGTPVLVVLQGLDVGFKEPLRGLYLTVGRNNLPASQIFGDDKAPPFDQVIELTAPQIHPNHLLMKWDELKNGYSVFKNPSVPEPVITRFTDGMEWHARLTNAGGFVRVADRVFLGETLIEIQSPDSPDAETQVSPVRLDPS